MEYEWIGGPTDASRISKNKTIPTSYIMRIFRSFLFLNDYDDDDAYSEFFKRPLSRDVDNYFNLVKNAAERNNDEAEWMYDLIMRNDGIKLDLKDYSDFDESLEPMFNWVLRLIPIESFLDPLVKNKNLKYMYYYVACALLNKLKTEDEDGFGRFDLENTDQIRLMLSESCRLGFSPAFVKLASLSTSTTKKKLLEHAYKLGDPDAAYILGHFEEASKLGFPLRETYLVNIKDDYVREKLLARTIFLTEEIFFYSLFNDQYKYEYEKKKKKNTYTQKDIYMLYVIGKELDGYDEFWNTQEISNDWFANEAINVYTVVTQRTRSAVLQLTKILQEKRFPRDVIRIITRRVYQERAQDVFLWYINPKLMQKKLERDVKRTKN